MSNKWKGKKNCLGETGIHGGRPSLAPWISGSCQLAMVSEFCPRVTGREWRWGWQFLIRLQQSACSLYLLTSLNKSLLGCNSDESSTGELSRESTECKLCATDNTCFMHFFFFLAALYLCSYAWAFSSCSKRASQCSGLSGCSTQALEQVAVAVVGHRFRCPVACEIFPDQGSNPRPRHRQMDS